MDTAIIDTQTFTFQSKCINCFIFYYSIYSDSMLHVCSAVFPTEQYLVEYLKRKLDSLEWHHRVWK